MHFGGLCAIAAVGLVGFASPVAGLSNTSPFVLLSDAQSLRLAHDAELGPAVMSMNSALESIVSDAAMSCDYNAYIFVKHPHVSERDVSSRSMPWLMHAAKKVRESVLLGTVLDGSDAEVDQTDRELRQSIAAKCGAQEVAVNPETGSFDYYADTKARILSIDLSHSDKSPQEVDTIMRDIVGHLPSANFLLTYRTTPPVQADNTDAQPNANSAYAPKQTSAQSGEIPYESVFRNYQFFSPGIFMGLISAGLALVVMLIALNAVASLQISPAAFEPRRQVASRKSG